MNNKVKWNNNINEQSNKPISTLESILINSPVSTNSETDFAAEKDLLRDKSNNLRVSYAIREINELNFMLDHNKLYINGLTQIINSTPDISVTDYHQIFEELESILSWNSKYNTFNDDVNEIISILKRYISYHDYKPSIDPSTESIINFSSDSSLEFSFEPIPNFDFGFINESYIRSDEIYHKWVNCDVVLNSRLCNLRYELKLLNKNPESNRDDISKRHGRYKGISYIKHLLDILISCCRKLRTWIRVEYELAEETLKRMETTEKHLYDMYHERFG